MNRAITLAVAALALAGCSSPSTGSEASSSTNAEVGAYTSASPWSESASPHPKARIAELSAEVDRINAEIESGDMTAERKAWLSDRMDTISAELDELLGTYGADGGTEDADEPTTEGTPDADYTGSCDYVLDPSYRFVATAYITNTGGVPFTARVTATWKQADGNHVRKSKTVKVAADAEEQEVYLTTKATSGQIDLIQALPTEKQCSVKVKVAG